MTNHEFTAAFLFCGLGAGAKGFIDSMARLGSDRAHFRNLGGIDNDPDACADFEYLTGGKAHVGDISKMTPEDIRAALGNERPDAIFLSPPCKGFSRLLSTKQSETEKYQALNRLVFQGVELACQSWARPPGLIVIENVPGITSRGKELLVQVEMLGFQHGLRMHRSNHDCGEIGGLGQHRRRFLLVMRDPTQVPAYVYRPPKQRVKGCGEILESLPLPEDPRAGELHKLPQISLLNWLRLSLIPAGGDWRDLPDVGDKSWFNGYMGIQDWGEPARTVVAGPANGAINIADPRLSSPVPEGAARRSVFARYDVRGWDQPARTIAGSGTNGGFAIADPRLGARRLVRILGPLASLAELVALKAAGENASTFKGRPGLFRVGDWSKPLGAVTGKARVATGNATAAIADPRVGVGFDPARTHTNLYRVCPWDHPTGTISGAGKPSSGMVSVADPRLGHAPRRNTFGVIGWEQPAGSVRGNSSVRQAAAAVADPRLAGLRKGSYGVTGWGAPAKTVTGESYPSNGSASVADPRVPERFNHCHRVADWQKPVGPITSGTHPSNGAPSVADPRIAVARRANRFTNQYKVKGWKEPTGAITGDTDIQEGAPSVADPRIDLGGNPNRHRNKYHVGDWEEPAPTVIGATRPGSGAPAVADPRVSYDREPFGNCDRVTAWAEPIGTVTHSPAPSSGAGAVADPRLRPRTKLRNDTYGVKAWTTPATTVTGSAKIDNGANSVADPRADEAPVLPPSYRPITIGEALAQIRAGVKKLGFVPVIVSADGTWHRPLTTLELAALQGIMWMLNGAPLKLAGKSVARWRERIGNAVPVQAGIAIAETLLTALLASKLGTWSLSSEAVWVRDDGLSEEEVDALEGLSWEAAA